MIYSAFKDKKLSTLGFGAMRLPTLDGGAVDRDETVRMVRLAMESGINYFDTAWGYHGGESEVALGRALADYPREDYYLATKFPGYDLSNMPKVKEIFPRQLERCGVEYFDFYLFHNVCEMNIDQYLDPQYDIFDYLMEQKKNGKIRHLGFSAHGPMPVIKRFMEKYGDAMEFVQLQLNWIDWEFQSGREKVEYFNRLGIPVWVMEPLRGGKLAAVEPEQLQKLKKLRPDETAVDWSFRFLQDIPGVKVVLSGMSTYEQLKQNIATFAESKPLNDEEKATLLGFAREMTGRTRVPCTACRYCVDHCPQGLDIPALLELYNEHSFTGGGFIAPMAMMALPEDKKPAACLGCRSCESVCPQEIKISEALSDFARILG